jgi:predicted flavoprotein YhiN
MVLSLSASAQDQLPAQRAAKEKIVTSHAIGTFDVKVTPQAPADGADADVGRMTLDKQFHGDLEGTSKGQMLAVSTSVKGSAGYVAMEKVTGTLKGRSGSFVLQHSGTMTRGEGELNVSVVPDSGTGELKGISGKMTIEISDGKHLYSFEYALEHSP